VLDLFAAAFSEQLDCESSVRPETRRHALIPLGPGGLVALLPALPCNLRHVTAGVPVGKDHPGLTAYPSTVAGRTRSRPVPGWQPRYSKC
jgi:hypothetical protein